MKQNNGRLILKVKKRRDSVPSSNKVNQHILNNKENEEAKRGQKRPNPFTKLDTVKKLKRSSPLKTVENTFLRKLEACGKSRHITVSHENTAAESTIPHNDFKEETEQPKYSYKKLEFPLDWSLKQKVRFMSSKPFDKCKHTKSVDESQGIVDFTERKLDGTKLCCCLHNWMHPCLPGISNFPVKSKSTVGVKDDKSLNIIASNKKFGDFVMDQWRSSFQSLFNMLKTKHCPYFYLCSYQLTVLFKASGVGENQMVAIVTPTTKGFRQMLKDEGISFELPLESTPSNVLAEENYSDHEDEECETNLLNDSNNDDFLDSIGLSKDQHFPSIEEQQRLDAKSKMRQLDNRPESTIKIKNCQALFNFLLNAKFLCPPSGNMMGVPPTLLSPAPFEGATLSKCKVTHGPVKHVKKWNTYMVNCVDVSGYILPTQLKRLVDLFADVTHDELIIQTKTFEKLCPLNIKNEEKLCSSNDDNRFGVSLSMLDYLNQKCTGLPDHSDIIFNDNEFKF